MLKLKMISEYFIFQLKLFSKSLDLVNYNTSVSFNMKLCPRSLKWALFSNQSLPRTTASPQLISFYCTIVDIDHHPPPLLKGLQMSTDYGHFYKLLVAISSPNKTKSKIVDLLKLLLFLHPWKSSMALLLGRPKPFLNWWSAAEKEPKFDFVREANSTTAPKPSKDLVPTDIVRHVLLWNLLYHIDC